MVTMEEARARVAKGAAHLDVVRPGWFNEIDVGTLQLSEACECIAGQLSGHRDVWLDLPFGFELTDETIGAFGFDLASGDGYGVSSEAIYSALQNAWLEAIADRRLGMSDECRQGLKRAPDGVTDVEDAWPPTLEVVTRS